MKPTEQLKTEHEAIKLMLGILDKVCDKLGTGQEANPEHLAQILDFIKTFSDRCHHGKEEELLFPEMEAAGIPKEGGPIGVMLIEHEKGRGYVRGMTEAVAGYQAGDRRIFSNFVANARNYTALLTQHIDKENDILYPMAEARISKKKQEELMSKFEELEKERIGPGRHEEFHQLLNHLKTIYLA